MIGTIEAAAKPCLTHWRTYEKELGKQGFNGPLQVTAIGWKVADQTELQKLHDQLLPLSEQVHIGTVNDRLIATYVLKQPLPTGDIRLIKVLQRRPGSVDPLGLDHLDFYQPDIQKAQRTLKTAEARWQLEANDVHEWISIRFGAKGEYEAKLVDHLVLDAAIAEMKHAKTLVLGN